MQAYGLLQLSCKCALNHDHTLYRLHPDKSPIGITSTWGKTHPKPKWVIRYIHLKSTKDQPLILHQEWRSTHHRMTQAKMPHMKRMMQIYSLAWQHMHKNPIWSHNKTTNKIQQITFIHFFLFSVLFSQFFYKKRGCNLMIPIISPNLACK